MTEIPKLGLGTWQNTDPEECTNAVMNALKIGYEHIDTAQVYDNEKEVGKGLEKSEVDRDEFF